MAIVPGSIPRPATVRYLPLRGTRLTFTISAALADPGAATPAARELLDRVTARQPVPRR